MKTLIVAGILALSLPALSACSPAGDTSVPEKSAVKKEMAVNYMDAVSASTLLARSPEIVVLDVRTPAEYADGHITGATNIDFKAPDFATKIQALDRSKTYLVHCRSGGRSTASLDAFRAAGFTQLHHLDGGILGWKTADLPVTR